MRPWLLRLFVGLVAFCLSNLAWAFLVEPNWIALTHHRVVAPPGSGLAAPLRIGHITDLHTTGLGGREARMVRMLLDEEPDVIVVTGDTVTADGTAAGYRAVWKALVEVGAEYGVINVRGNWEYWATGTMQRTDASGPMGASELEADELGVVTLVNANTRLREDLWVLGLDDPLAGHRDQPLTRRGVPDDVYRLGLMHSPEVAHAFAKDVHLVLAGHSHGGQIVLPLLGPPWLPPGVGDYVAGWYEEEGTPIFVNRGLGTSVLPVRWNCRPEVAIIEVVPAS